MPEIPLVKNSNLLIEITIKTQTIIIISRNEFGS